MENGDIFAAAALFVAAIAMFMYVIIMGPSRFHRDGKVGRVYMCLVDCPAACCGCFCGIFFGCNYRRGRQACTRCANHTIHERNSLTVIFYIALVWSVEFMYLLIALPQVQASPWSKLMSCLLVGASEFFYGLAVVSNPGVVTAREMKEAQRAAFASRAEKKNKRAIMATGKNNNNNRREEEGGNAVEMQRNQKRGKNEAAAGGSGGDGSSKNDSKNINENKKKKKELPEFHLSPEEEERLNRKYIVDGILYAMDGSGMEKKADDNNDNNTAGPPAVVTTRTALGVECTTCHVHRPSRSKHCRLCNCCVRRYDHHCPWINNDVAEGTHRWFLLFILCHAVSCFWAAWDLYSLMRTFLIHNNAWGWVFRHSSGRLVSLTALDYLAILATHQTLATALFFFAVMIGLVLWIFWLYQMSFVVENLTVNDMCKIDDAVVFVTTLPALGDVYREAVNIRRRLEVIAARPPCKLMQLGEPPQNIAAGSRADKSYRRKVKKMLSHDLRGVFNRGVWKNLMEVFFPYTSCDGKDGNGAKN